MLDLAMDRRTGNKGPVRLYDWAGIIDDYLLAPVDAVFTNRSAVVTAASNPFVAAHAGEWVRFDPFEDANGVMQNPGDFGYKIGVVNGAGQVTLTEIYRGPTSAGSTMVIRPIETQTFRLYGIPTVDDDDIVMKVYRRPRRLYNNEDVPEWPSLGLPIANMGVGMGLRHMQRYDEANVWIAEAYALLGSIRRRRRKTEMLTPHLPPSSIVGRQTGITTVRPSRYGGIR